MDEQNDVMPDDTVEDTADAPDGASTECEQVPAAEEISPGVMEALNSLLERMGGLENTVNAIADKMGAFSSMLVDAGAEVTDGAGDTVEDPSEPDIIDVPNIDDIDLDM